MKIHPLFEDLMTLAVIGGKQVQHVDGTKVERFHAYTLWQNAGKPVVEEDLPVYVGPGHIPKSQSESNAIRNEALEEAAKVCWPHEQFNPRSVDELALVEAAARIRGMKK